VKDTNVVPDLKMRVNYNPNLICKAAVENITADTTTSEHAVENTTATAGPDITADSAKKVTTAGPDITANSAKNVTKLLVLILLPKMM
jgi:hypothetical protein